MLPLPSIEFRRLKHWVFNLLLVAGILCGSCFALDQSAPAETKDNAFKIPTALLTELNTDGFDPKKHIREWSDDTGSHKVRAGLEGESEQGVTLVKPDGSRIIVPHNRLSSRDKVYLALIDKENSKDRMYQLGYNSGFAEMNNPNSPAWRRWAVLVLPVVALLLGIAILVQAFRESILWGLGVLLIPCVYFIFALVHWHAAGRYLVYQIIALAATGFIVSLEMPKTIQTIKESVEIHAEIVEAMEAQGLNPAGR